MNDLHEYMCYQEQFNKMKLGNLYVAKKTFNKFGENELFLLTNIEFIINKTDIMKYPISGACVLYTFLNGKDFYKIFFSLRKFEDALLTRSYNHISNIHEYFELFSEDTYEELHVGESK